MDNKSKIVLVTGATGFVGQHVVRQLLKEGHSVVATGTDLTKTARFDWSERVRFLPYTLPLVGDSQNLFDFFGRPNAVIHLAWQGLPNYKALFHLQQNLFPHFLFLNNLVVNGLANLTVIGTCFEYGMQSGPLSEHMPTAPANPYALAKDALRQFLETLKTDYHFCLKWIRLFYMYGEGQSANSLIPLLDQAIERGDSVFNMSGGEQLRDYLTVAQVAQYISQIAIQTQVEGVINCCNGQPISVRRLVEEHVQKRRASIRLNMGYYPYPDYEPMAFWGDNTRLKTVINF